MEHYKKYTALGGLTVTSYQRPTGVIEIVTQVASDRAAFILLRSLTQIKPYEILGVAASLFLLAIGDDTIQINIVEIR